MNVLKALMVVPRCAQITMAVILALVVMDITWLVIDTAVSTSTSVLQTLMTVPTVVSTLMAATLVPVILDTVLQVMGECVMVSTSVPCIYLLSLTPYNKHATDIDECDEDTDGCAQTCTNTNGSYVCSCDLESGYRLALDNYGCSGECL